MTLTCVHVMLFACNTNIYVCSANCLRPVQVPSPRSMHADAAGASCAEPGAGGLRLFGFWYHQVCVFRLCSNICTYTLITRFYLYRPTTRNFNVEVATTTASSFWV